MFEMLTNQRPISGAFKMTKEQYVSLFKNRANESIFDIPSEFDIS
jgi:hypothetical protein